MIGRSTLVLSLVLMFGASPGVRAQMTEELPGHEREHREPILGGWCFSDGRHRWPVSFSLLPGRKLGRARVSTRGLHWLLRNI